MSSTLELETIPSITEEFAVEPPTDLEEEIGFEEPELAALEEIEAELESELESETEIEDLEKQISRELGIWKSKTEEVSQDERDDSFWLFEEQAISQ